MKKNIIFVVILFLFSIINVNAEVLTKDFTGYYFEWSDNGENYVSWYFENYYVDGNIAYCIQPGTKEGTDEYVIGSFEDIGLSTSVFEKVILYAYYGYQYPTHDTQEFRAAAQSLIWETILGGNTKVTFSTGINGTGTIYDVSEEKEIITDLVEHHNDLPSFANQSLTSQVGKAIVIEDANGILSDFEVVSDDGATVSIDSNILTIIPNEIGEATITFRKKQVYNEVYLIYYASIYQNMITGGNVSDVTFSLTVNGLGGKVSLEKVDSDGNSYVDASLEGATYGIYDTNMNLIEVLTTDKSGKAISNYLPYLGDYYLKEISPSVGYLLSDEVILFNISRDSMLTYVKASEEVIKRNLEITKVYASNQTEILTPEANVTFGIYNSAVDLIYELTTNDDGKIYAVLPYGDYTLKQLTTTPGYEKIADYSFKVAEEDISLVLSNAPLKTYVKVIKTDEEGNILPVAGFTFKIYDTQKEEYVCQTITYPNEQTLCEFTTSSDGTLITPYELDAGTYILEEVDSPVTGYLWNSLKISFTIADYTSFVSTDYGLVLEITYPNTEVKGEVTLEKIGEELILDNGSYYYEDVYLDDVAFDLFANEDIYSASGVLIYKQDDFIGSYTTVAGYLTVSDLYLGSYYFIETSSLDGYVINDEKIVFTLDYVDQYTPVVYESILVKNYLAKGTLYFTKWDSLTYETLPNTTIQIYNENDELVYEGITNEDGKIILSDLVIGSYYLIETLAPDGYKLSTEIVPFSILENGAVVSVNMVDELIEVPKTSQFDYSLEQGITLIIGGLSLLIYEKKTRQKAS